MEKQGNILDSGELSLTKPVKFPDAGLTLLREWRMIQNGHTVRIDLEIKFSGMLFKIQVCRGHEVIVLQDTNQPLVP